MSKITRNDGILCSIMIIACIFGISFLHMDILFTISVMILGIACIRYGKAIYDNFSVFFYLMTFFFFLMGAEFVSEVFDITLLRDSNEKADFHYKVVILISLIGLLIGYRIKIKSNGSAIDYQKLNTDKKTLSIRKISKVLFYVTVLFYILPTVEKIVFVRNFSYYESYISYSSIIPIYFIKIGEMCPASFAFYLATFPPRKECKPILVVYIICAVLYILTGKRYITVSSIVFVIAYCLLRNKTDESENEKWIRGKTIFLLLALLPFFGAWLAAYSTIRTGSSLYGNETFGLLLSRLFTSVGDSDKVIKYGYIFKDQFPPGHFYTFGSLIDYFKYGTLSSLFSSSGIRVAQTAEYALKGNGYSYTLSYLYYPSMFLSGHGLGSCYIAELFQDAGYIGVFLGNLFMGILLKNLFNTTKNSVFKNAVLFYSFRLLLLTPRNDFDVVFRELLGVGFIATTIIVYLFSRNTRRNNVL